MKKHLRLILATLVALALSACAKKDAASPSNANPALTPVTVQLDWVPEPEHGGLFQAQARGWFREAGLDVTLVPGGPNALVNQRIATGQAQLGQGESVTTLLDVHKGLPLLQVAAVFQNDPSVFLLHADNPVRDFKDLAGRKIMARPGWIFLDYLRQKYAIDFTVIPFNFSVSNFIADPAFIQQGYYIAEPFFITQGGAPAPKYLYAWDAGYDSYAVLIANPEWAKQNPAALRAFLAAYIRGWRDYLEGDPAPAHAAMKQANPNNTDAFLAFSRQMIIDEKLVIGRDATDATRIGRLDPARYARQLKIVEDLKLLPPGALKVPDVMSTEYLPPAPKL
ncbi:MAG: ABC transporter substrate-binding protein [Verrucomicrobia bacterium]|nr:ABC transporter substrate-binding protein [Verrucomicrobiota bacterium]